MKAEIDIFSQLAQARNIHDFKKTMAGIVDQLGFTDFSFGVINAPLGKRLSTLPDIVQEFELKNNFPAIDMQIGHALMSDLPLFRSVVQPYIVNAPFSSNYFGINAEYTELLEKLGYIDSYMIPANFGPNRAFLLLFAKDIQKGAFQEKVDGIAALLPMIMQAIIYFASTMFAEFFLQSMPAMDVPLTPKPLRMLETVAKDGLQLKDAARKHNVSLDTANKHVAAAKQALGATTLANSVYLAIKYGMIKVDDSHDLAQRAGTPPIP